MPDGKPRAEGDRRPRRAAGRPPAREAGESEGQGLEGLRATQEVVAWTSNGLYQVKPRT